MNEQVQKPSDDELALATLAFLHRKLLATTFYPEEFEHADRALKFIISLAEQLDTKLKKVEEQSTEASS